MCVLNIEDRVFAGVCDCQFHIEVEVAAVGAHEKEIPGDVYCELFADSF